MNGTKKRPLSPSNETSPVETKHHIGEDNASLRCMPRCFDATLCPPPSVKHPRKIVVLMRHGDRSPYASKMGTLDFSHFAPAWECLMPTAEEQDTIERIPVQQSEKSGTNSYAKYMGKRPWGQLTSLGFTQCKAVGVELRSRYPNAKIRAFSTCFPRTQQSAAAVLVGFGADPCVPIIVRSPSEEVLLPNFDGRCQRYADLRQSRFAEARKTNLRRMFEKLESKLIPIIGENPLTGPPVDFRPLCIHEDTVGTLSCVDWVLMHECEQYLASREAFIHDNEEAVRLSCGRLLNWIVNLLAEPEHEVVLLLAHDNMLTAFLMALGVFRWDWPIYASAVIVETADFDGKLNARVQVNNEVRCDWVPLDDFIDSISSVRMTSDEYEAACS